MKIYTSTNARRCASCFQAYGRCVPSCPDHPDSTQRVPLPETTLDGLTVTGVLRAVDKGPQRHAKDRYPVPMRYVVCVFLGFVCVALGILREPVSRLLWELITGA